MRTSRFLSSLLIVMAALFVLSTNSFAAEPGIPFPADGVVNDQKPGSILIYNVYISSPTNSAAENTRISITNTSDTTFTSVHLFFIDGATCSPADSIICLTPRQTAVLRASDVDPGTMGYIVAVAIDPNGCPVIHNKLIGDEYVKFATGHQANLAAESVSALTVPVCNDTDSTAVLNFNGIQYDQLPQTLALDNIASRVDNNDTLLILNRVSGNLGIGADALGAVTGLLYNDTENAYSFSFTSSQCQIKFSINNTTPRTAPRFTNVVPSGRSGWMKFFNYTGAPLLGAAINLNPGSSASPTAFDFGHNLHKLRLSPSSSILIPIFPPNC
ncbi:MAG: hypothetical protein ABI977_25490 [Acidobacteriota bacterium]